MKKDIFEGSASEGEDGGLTVNKKYASQYAKRKEKEAMMKAMEANLSSSYESTSEEEDSDAELLTEAVETKIFETIAKIKNKDPSIYESDKPIFTEDDFINETTGSDQKTAKKITYKDLMRETLLAEGAEAFEDNRPAKRLRTPWQVEEDARLAFKAAVDSDEEASAEDDGLTVKQKAEVPSLTKEESIERAKKLSTMAGVWGDTTDANEVFLRDFIVNERWKERESLQTSSKKVSSGKTATKAKEAVSDTEDERYLEKTDEFEREYNFRFEEDGGTKITGHARAVEDSVRLKDDKRKRKRDELKQKKEELKKQKEEELKRLKNLKMQELNRRLEQIAQVTGNKRISNEKVNVLDTEFDPDQHDQQVQQLIGDDYYDQADEDYQQEDDGYYGADDYAEENEWFLCDGCEKPIEPGKRMYQCTSCEDFVVCGSCQRKIEHPHKLRREVVPDHCVPPQDWGKVEEEKETAMDEVFAMDFEDIIGGDIATRFKYRKVEKQDFGLTAEDLLNKSDSYLNNKVSLKKIYPYRNQ